jgi:hypothetical protein
MVDPCDYVEAALADAGTDVAKLSQVKRDLEAIAQQSDREMLVALLDEDDRDERLAVLDYNTFVHERLIEAHRAYLTRLQTIALLRR